MKRKKLLWATSGILLAAAPIGLLVSCKKDGNDTEKDGNVTEKVRNVTEKVQNDKEVINLDTSSKIKLAIGAKKFYDTFLSEKTLDKKNYELDINMGNVSEKVTLKKAEVQQVRSADDIPAITDETNIDSFKEAAEAILGQDAIYVLGKKESLFSKLKASKGDVIAKIISKDFGGTLPGDIELKDILDKDGNNITFVQSLTGKTTKYQLVFEGKDGSGATKKINVKAKINIDKKQSTVDKHESKGGKIKQAIAAVHEKIRGFISKFKEIFVITKDKINDWGTIAVGLVQNIVDAIVEKSANLIPPLAIITKIPVLGGKIISFIENKVINPIVEKVMKPIAEKLNKEDSK